MENLIMAVLMKINNKNITVETLFENYKKQHTNKKLKSGSPSSSSSGSSMFSFVVSVCPAALDTVIFRSGLTATGLTRMDLRFSLS
jgi:hypothetical protein